MTRNASQQEFKRRIIGAILASGLTSREIDAFAADLIENPSSAVDLGLALRAHLNVLGAEQPRMLPDSQSTHANWLSAASKAMEKQGISKKELVSMILEQGVLPHSHSSLMRQSTRDLLNLYLQHSNATQSNALLKRLGSTVEPDPYLKGIEQR
jgi:hypothetical protein